MTQYIDKDAVVAEIERRWKYDQGFQTEDETKAYQRCCDDILYVIKTLEVKEVDLKTSIDDYINSHFTEGCDGGMISDWYKVLGGVHYKDLMELAKHFFELGLKVQNVTL